MSLAINNIKFGFTIKPPSLYLPKLDYLSDFFEVKKKGNIVTLRTEDYVFIIFTSGHINATGVKSLDLIEDCLDFFLTIFSLPYSNSDINVRIDNISASCFLGHPLHVGIDALRDITKVHQGTLSFNQEAFPGITINLPWGTLIIFTSGKINAVGVKKKTNLRMLQSVINEIKLA